MALDCDQSILFLPKLPQPRQHALRRNGTSGESQMCSAASQSGCAKQVLPSLLLPEGKVHKELYSDLGGGGASRDISDRRGEGLIRCRVLIFCWESNPSCWCMRGCVVSQIAHLGKVQIAHLGKIAAAEAIFIGNCKGGRVKYTPRLSMPWTGSRLKGWAGRRWAAFHKARDMAGPKCRVRIPPNWAQSTEKGCRFFPTRPSFRLHFSLVFLWRNAAFAGFLVAAV